MDKGQFLNPAPPYLPQPSPSGYPGQQPPRGPGYAPHGQAPPPGPGYAPYGQAQPPGPGYAPHGQAPPPGPGYAPHGQAPPPRPGYGQPPQQYGGYYPPQPAMSSQQSTDTTLVIQQPQTVVTTIVPSPYDFMGLSIFGFLCCFWPVGAVAIFLSLQVRNHYNSGNLPEAIAVAERARNFGYLSIGLGVLTYIIMIISLSA